MFKERFKYYKKKCPPPDLNTVFKLTTDNLNKVKFVSPKEDLPNISENLGLQDLCLWKIYEISSHPGLIVVKNLFTAPGQRYWIRKCLEDYTKHPCKNNLLLHGLLSPGDNWWDICNRDKEKRNELYKQMRWVTLGYHHNWDTKVYSEDMRSDFPSEIHSLCQIIGRVVGGWNVDVHAAIINFYHMDSTLSGHTDHSEPNNTAPLFSFSFGQSAVFLIGGLSVEDPATSILVESGDCIIMSGKSRLSHHGIPRIVKAEKKPWQYPNSCDRDWELAEKYISDSRINLNVRQVLHPGQSCLNDRDNS